MSQAIKIRDTDLIKAKYENGTTASYPAMRLMQNKQKFYLATIPVYDIFPFAFVSSRDKNPEVGFQRMLDSRRAMDIARYLDYSKGSIPTNIVLSAQDSAKIRYVSKTKTIKYKRGGNAFLVIDGQHRLYGYGLTKRDHRVPVAIYEGLTRQQETALFIDINTNQKGVPSALLLDIKQLADRENDSERCLREFFDRFNHDSNSPLCGYLSPSSSKRGMISRVTFNKGMKIVVESPKMSSLGEDKRYQLILNYLNALEHNLSDFEILLKSAYFEAFCEVFEDASNLAFTEHSNYKEESFTESLKRLRNIDFTAIISGGKTRVTKSTIVQHLKTMMAEGVEITDDLL